ncbi:conjugal transfer protein TraN, partial [Pseudomonas shirazica]
YGWASKAWNPPSNLVLHWNEPSYTLNWRSSCSNLVPECQPNPRRCIEGPETRNINGIDITLACWKYQTDYQCQFDDTCSALSDCDYQSTS